MSVRKEIGRAVRRMCKEAQVVPMPLWPLLQLLPLLRKGSISSPITRKPISEKPTGKIGPVSGLPTGHPVNEYLKLVPVADSHPTEKEWTGAVSRYKKLLDHPDVRNTPYGTGPRGSDPTEQLMRDFHNAAFWGRHGYDDDDAHEGGKAALSAAWHLVHDGIGTRPVSGKPDGRSTRDALFAIASMPGNEKMRDAMYNGITNRLWTIHYSPTWDKQAYRAIPFYRNTGLYRNILKDIGMEDANVKAMPDYTTVE